VVGMARLATMLGLVAVTGFATVAGFAALAVIAFSAFAFPAMAVAFAALAFAALAFAAFAFAAFAFAAFAFSGLFAGAFVWNVTTFAMHAGGFGFFTRAFVWNAGAFAMHARWFVLVEACTAPAAATTGQGERAAGAEHEKPDCEEGCQALPEESLGLRGARAPRRAHRAQLHSVERERVERGAPVAEHVCDVLEVIGEAFVFM
jgi:hypothetical protein